MVLHSHFLMVRLVRVYRLSGATEDAAVLTAVKDAARDCTGCAQVGMEGWCRSNKRMERRDAAGLPATASGAL